MRKTYIGELEEVVLLTVALLYNEAYGVSITQSIFEQTGRSISVSAIHATLHRLEKKGLVNSRMGGATTERGGRRKRYFTVTPAGSNILHEIQQVRTRLWEQIAPNVL